jgi:hypothetical protein
MRHSTFSIQLIRAVANGAGAKYLAPNISCVARDADCSATLVRRFLVGERIGEQSEKRIRHALGLDGVSSLRG